MHRLPDKPCPVLPSLARRRFPRHSPTNGDPGILFRSRPPGARRGRLFLPRSCCRRELSAINRIPPTPQSCLWHQQTHGQQGIRFMQSSFGPRRAGCLPARRRRSATRTPPRRPMPLAALGYGAEPHRSAALHATSWEALQKAPVGARRAQTTITVLFALHRGHRTAARATISGRCTLGCTRPDRRTFRPRLQKSSRTRFA